MSGKLQDMKTSLRSGRKPDLSHMRKSAMIYCARQCEYGSEKYQRANYMRPTGDVSDTPTSADFERMRGYAAAALRHLVGLTDSLEEHQAIDPELQDVKGMQRAAYAVDLDNDGKFPASRLPHVGGVLTSMIMLIEQATRCGLLPKDPGQPWKGEVPFQFAESLAREGTITVQLKGNRLIEQGELLTLEDFVVHGIDESPPPDAEKEIASVKLKGDDDPEHYSEVHPDGCRVTARKHEYGYDVIVEDRICFGAVGKDAWERALGYMNNRKRLKQERADFEAERKSRR